MQIKPHYKATHIITTEMGKNLLGIKFRWKDYSDLSVKITEVKPGHTMHSHIGRNVDYDFDLYNIDLINDNEGSITGWLWMTKKDCSIDDKVKDILKLCESHLNEVNEYGI